MQKKKNTIIFVYFFSSFPSSIKGNLLNLERLFKKSRRKERKKEKNKERKKE